MKSWRGPPSEAARAELNAAEGAYPGVCGGKRLYPFRRDMQRGHGQGQH
jgi:hypothetical protein